MNKKGKERGRKEKLNILSKKRTSYLLESFVLFHFIVKAKESPCRFFNKKIAIISQMSGKLYLIATPIGNLKDITLRAIEVLSFVDVLACEDTRKTGLLLQKFEIKNKPQLISYYEENESGRIPQLLSFLKEGKNVGLVSNAGTPAISDPGYKLVKTVVENNIELEVIPGPSSVLNALLLSGLPTDKFLFIGFLPKKEGKRKNVLESLPKQTTIILFESPFRILKTLNDLKLLFGDIKIVICREMTKVHQEVLRDNLSNLISHFGENKPRGEIVICFNLLK